LASAAKKAGAKSAVFSTVAPKPPKLLAMAAKSGLRRSVPLTRPGYSRSDACGWCPKWHCRTPGDDRQPVLHGGGEFLAVHQEIPVAIDRQNGALWIKGFHRHRSRYAIPMKPQIVAIWGPKRRKR
jgi:hypothetical protein